jgi:hypothetical protein
MPPLAALLQQTAAEFRRDAPGHTVLVEWLVRTALLHVVRAHLAAAPSASPASANWWKTPKTKNCSPYLILLQYFPGNQWSLDAISSLQVTSATRLPQETISCCTSALHEYRLSNGRFLVFDTCRERQLFICRNGSNGHFALTDQVKFAAEKRSPWFESSGPAKTTDEESIHSLIDSP